MCGIAGIVGLDPVTAQPVIQKMTAAIKHRGPDAEGIFTDNKVMFGHCRLSIIDLSNGANQPFHDQTDQYVIVFNGEIYNYMDVRAKIDYPWKTSSDTEVILAAYIKWGRDCLQHLNGMFALAIWDKAKQELFIARDRIGIKPFYYFHSGQVFIFSSEIRSILETGLVKRKISRQGLLEYLGSMSVKTPGTIIQDVFQLNPGECGFFRDGKLSRHTYWSMDKGLDKRIEGLTYEETKKKTLALFEASIKNRMVSDVKVGAFLSGGIDSSAAVAVMSQFSTQPVETFSIVFEEKDFDESEYSRLIAKKYNTKHTELPLKPRDLIGHLPDYIRHMDTPTVDGINTYMVSKMVAKTGIKVVLTGVGGDELFVGYRNFRRWKDYKKNKFLFNNIFAKLAIGLVKPFVKHRAIAKISDFQKRRGGDLETFYGNSRSIFLRDEIERLFDGPVNMEAKNWLDLDSEDVKSFPLYSQYSIAEMTNYTLDVLLKDTDQMSMAWALEVREPFFDYHLVEFILSVPDKYKLDSKTPKKLLVDALGELLPGEIVYRPKKGFSFPWDNWLRNDLKAYCEESIIRLSKRGIFNEKNLMDLWNRFLAHDKTITWSHLWSFVILEQWMKENNINEQ
jgi:asparagine synthase (glutamine-hydrolysing)